ncbi:predicted GPI-anchored protein 58 [Cyclospora cayetanensis]|uniref:Predicted GPI-anchored protein 58 n=1 Tax=Cyclospora cayetanensis TaxID=88456 RepID=A0A6P6RWE3_9EIME|nr:predicted GPI-anchored protein 58 [Cyclospora cayetanensis]
MVKSRRAAVAAATGVAAETAAKNADAGSPPLSAAVKPAYIPLSTRRQQAAKKLPSEPRQEASLATGSTPQFHAADRTPRPDNPTPESREREWRQSCAQQPPEGSAAARDNVPVDARGRLRTVGRGGKELRAPLPRAPRSSKKPPPQTARTAPARRPYQARERAALAAALAAPAAVASSSAAAATDRQPAAAPGSASDTVPQRGPASA